MIADCPSNYTNLTIADLCKSTFNISKPRTIVDHVPVNDIKHGIAYKNHNCYLCNTASVDHARFWTIKFECISHRDFFVDVNVHNPFDAIERILKLPKCSILFRTPNQFQDRVHSNLEKCTFQSTKRSCKQKYAGTNLDLMCTTESYIWPINHKQVYANLACLLCNDADIHYKCRRGYNSLKGILNMHISKMSNIDKNKGNETVNLSINRYFPDKWNVVECPKGFVFHDKKVIYFVWLLFQVFYF